MGGETMSKVLVLVAVAGLVLVLVLAGCVSEDNAAARRAAEESARVRAEAEAYQVRAAADAAAASERASTRQMERDASHERALETLPFVLAIGGGVLLLVLAGLVAWDLRSRQAPASTVDSGMLFYLERHERRLLELERAAWHAVATAQRSAALEPAERGGRGVVVYDEKQW